MSLYDTYKADCPDSIVLFKMGSYYLTFDMDAEILKEIFGYRIVNDKVAIPYRFLPRVTNRLDEMSINYTIFKKDDKIKKEFINNKYNDIFYEIKSFEFRRDAKKELLNKIERLIIDTDYYNKIKKFIDEI